MDREEAENHWLYTKGVIDKVLDLTHYLYVEAMVHGGKHEMELKKTLDEKLALLKIKR